MNTVDDELGIEPDDLGIEPDDHLELGIEPETAEVPAGPAQPATPAASLAVMEILPADFPLPILTRFVPDVRLRTAADEAARYALSIEVSGPEGLQAADAALGVIRTSLKDIEDHFAEPKDIANRLHKSITGTLAEWLSTGKGAADTVGRRIYTETQRLKRIEEEARRKAQEEENRRAREEARRRAEEAAKAQAPPAIVENLQKQAEVAQAAPVSTPSMFAGSASVLQHSTLTKRWTCTIAGTPREAETQQPDTEEMTEAQQATFRELLKAIVEGREPLVAVSPNWKYLNKRAKADEGLFKMTGIDAYDAGGTRAKGARRK